MAEGKEDIDAALAHMEPLLRDGGYIPWCDHLVPPDVPFDNYLYYVARVKEATQAASTLQTRYPCHSLGIGLPLPHGQPGDPAA